MRWANAPASLSLYGMCALIWLFRGSLAQWVALVRTTFSVGQGG